MKKITRFTAGDEVPDDATLITVLHHVNYKHQERVVEFYYLVPVRRKKRKVR